MARKVRQIRRKGKLISPVLVPWARPGHRFAGGADSGPDSRDPHSEDTGLEDSGREHVGQLVADFLSMYSRRSSRRCTCFISR